MKVISLRRALPAAPGEAWDRAQRRLLRTYPTTLAGLLALIGHLDRHATVAWIDDWGGMAFDLSACRRATC
jgi:hypothetical protein